MLRSSIRAEFIARSVVGQMPVFEFEQSIPSDDIEVTVDADPGNLLEIHPGARLSPNSCKIVNEFVSLTQAAN